MFRRGNDLNKKGKLFENEIYIYFIQINADTCGRAR